MGAYRNMKGSLARAHLCSLVLCLSVGPCRCHWRRCTRSSRSRLRRINRRGLRQIPRWRAASRRGASCSPRRRLPRSPAQRQPSTGRVRPDRWVDFQGGRRLRFAHERASNMASGLRGVYSGIAPEDVLAELCSGAGADFSSVGRREQARRLEAWFRAGGFGVSRSNFGARFVGAGAEHETYVDAEGGCAFKLTHDGRFGHCLRDEGALATPLDYLLRLAWHNELFGDDIRLHGALEGSAGLRLVTSQPWIVAHAQRLSPTQDEIDAYLSAFGFSRSAAYPDGFIYFNASAGLVIGDAQPTNLLLDEDGNVRPIDLVIAAPEPAFAMRLKAAESG